MWTFDQRVEKPIAYLRKKYPNIKFEKIINDRALRKVKLAFVNGEFPDDYQEENYE
jgi:hypothetical protein